MTILAPFPVIWSDGAFVPASKFHIKRCKEHFEEGKKYTLVEHMERSGAGHAHYFAALHEAFDNLPEDISHEFPTFEQFRAVGLISTGFYVERRIVLETEKEAWRVARFMRRPGDLSIISVFGCAVVERTARSQSYRSMDRTEFRKSKEAVLEWAWALVGVDPETGNANAGAAA